MRCKNCTSELSQDDKFCSDCGAKIVTGRITGRGILAQLSAFAFNWDNNVFRTLKGLILSPGILLDEYLSGTRKKYANPFGFFAFTAALSLFVLNQSSDQYLKTALMMDDAEFEQIIDKEYQEKVLNTDESGLSREEKEELRGQQSIITNLKIQQFILKYYQLVSFLLLPLYALISILVYPKPLNFGEHLVVNAFLQGFLFLLVLIFFGISLLTHPNVSLISYVLMVVYYPYAYGNLFNHNLKRMILKFLRFLLVMLGFTILLTLFGFVYVLITKMGQ